MASKFIKVTATGLVVAGGGRLKSVILTPAAALSKLSWADEATGGGTDECNLQAAASGNSAVWKSGDPDGVVFSSGIYATVTGASAIGVFEVEV